MAATIQQQIAQVDAQIAELQAVRRWLERQQPGKNGASPTRTRKRRTAGSLTIADAAEQALRETGAPARTADLLVLVRERGATCKNAEGLYKTLARTDRFKKAGQGLWTLA